LKILATYNIKGGVGKTATAVNLAHLAAREGARTLVWDLDPQGAASFYFRIKPKVKGFQKLLDHKKALDDVVKGTDFEQLDLIPADFAYRNLDLALADYKKPVRQLLKLLRPLSEEYDFLFLDCAPSISLVSENVFYAADALLVPMIPTTLSLRTYDQLVGYLDGSELKHTKVLPFFSMVDRRKRLHREIIENLPETRPGILRTDIPYASQVELMGIHRAPLTAFAPGCPAGLAYVNLWGEIKAGI
jgi:chromosome partitioning protein